MHFQRQGFKRLTLNGEKKRGLRLFQAIDGRDGKDRDTWGDRGLSKGEAIQSEKCKTRTTGRLSNIVCLLHCVTLCVFG